MNGHERSDDVSETQDATRDAFLFASFELVPSRRLLLESGARVVVGSRAFDLLTKLVSHAGEIVTKDALLQSVWPGVSVEEGALRVHVAALRKALGDGRDGRRFIVNTPGRGYSFVSPVARAAAAPIPAQGSLSAAAPRTLPTALEKMVGRDQALQSLALMLPQRRLVTIVGPGGIGKTTVALATANALGHRYADGVRFIDLAPLSDPGLAASGLASALGLTVGVSEVVADVVRFLQPKNMLIVLDNCEHVIGAAAALAQEIIANAPGANILATSREALRARGEHVFRLPPLETPPLEASLIAEEALRFSAVQLFVERVRATLGSFDLADADAPAAGEICRRLDGLPLAIELAASRVDVFGVRGVAAQLDDRFRLLTRGARTAMPHHQTLTATFDWSYLHLPETSRAVFRRLGVLAGEFSMESAMAIASGPDLSPTEVADEVANLVSASILTADVQGESPTYRLLESARAYALDRLAETGELEAISRRHATHFLEFLLQLNASYKTRTAAASGRAYRPLLDDVRAALGWTLSEANDVETGISLTIAAAPLWSHLSLDNEWQTRSEAALAALAPIEVAPDRRMMQLSGALGSARLYVEGGSPRTIDALTQALQIAESLGDSAYQLSVLYDLWAASYMSGQRLAAERYTEKFSAAAMAAPALVDTLLAASMSSLAHFYRGKFREARSTLEETLSVYANSQNQLNVLRLPVDQRMTAGIILAKTLWLQGYPEQAENMAEFALNAARAADHDLSLMSGLANIGSNLPVLKGGVAAAERGLDTLHGLLRLYPPNHFCVLAQCWRGVLQARTGDVQAAAATLGAALEKMPPGSFAMFHSRFLGEHAYLLACCGDLARAREEIDTALRLADEMDERWFFAELLRLKGEIALAATADDEAGIAEALFDQSLALAKLQGARSWELRTAMSIARLRSVQGRRKDGRDLLEAVYSGFTEGFSTQDLLSARALLDS